MGFSIGNLTKLPLGQQNENKSRQIDIDVSEWLRDWPGATINLMVRRPGDEEFYPANTKIQGGHLLWWPERADVAEAGEGEAQIILTGPDDVELRSRVVKTVIGESMSGTEGETPPHVAGWVNTVLQAAKEVKESVDVGDGGMYLIRQNVNNVLDRTYEEIEAAIAAGKTCVLVNALGRVHLFADYGASRELIFQATEHGTVIGGGDFTSLTEREVIISKDGTSSSIAISPVKTPTPYALTIEHNRERVNYDGTKAINVKIEGGVPDSGMAHQQIVSNAVGKTEWVERELYTVKPVVFPWDMTVDADAPAGSIYLPDGTDSGVRWVRVSDYAPETNEVIERTTVLTSGTGVLKVTDENIFDSTEDGYLIAREVQLENPTRTIRIVYAVVCLESGYVANGYPSASHIGTATLPEPGLYLPVGINSENTSYGFRFDEYVKPLDDKYIPDTVARKRDLENIVPPDGSGTVTDEHINSLIDRKLSGFGGVYVMNERDLLPLGDGEQFAIMTPWEKRPVPGDLYKVNYNGTDYKCECIALPADMGAPDGAFAFGNVSVIGIEGGNENAPFALLGFPDGMDGTYGALMPLDGATTVKLSIRSATPGYYYYDGNTARIATIEQLKADLGLTGGDTTTDQVFYTADGEVFTTLDGAVFHVRKEME